MSLDVKICGLSTVEGVEAALESGADLIGLVFFPPSPRNVDLDQARHLADRVRGKAKIVALLVDPDDDLYVKVMDTVAPDSVQLHGNETPERLTELKRIRNGVFMKAIGIADKTDLGKASAWTEAADYLLMDAKQPKDASRPGGNGQVFDWSLLADFESQVPWYLSGGLTPENISTAYNVSKRAGFAGVDVSSGVESSPGVKDPALIRDFVTAARDTFQDIGNTSI